MMLGFGSFLVFEFIALSLFGSAYAFGNKGLTLGGEIAAILGLIGFGVGRHAYAEEQAEIDRIYG